jgi:hypothetical protein
MKGDKWDPKALVREAYRIEGISAPECRTIFLDWALSLPEGIATREALDVLIERHGGDADHPMSVVLRDGLEQATARGRRGGRLGRVRN